MGASGSVPGVDLSIVTFIVTDLTECDVSLHIDLFHNKNETTDHTGLMGNPLYDDDVGRMCFNPAKVCTFLCDDRTSSLCSKCSCYNCTCRPALS